MDDLPELTPGPSSPPAIPGPSPDSLYANVLAGRSEKTAKAYRQDYADFARFLGLPGPAEALSALVGWSQATANHCAYQFRAHLHARGLSPATIARRLGALRSAVKLARAFGLCPWVLEVDPPRHRAYRDTRGPGSEGWMRLLAEAQRRAVSPMGRRDLAMVLLMHDLGLRRGEVVGLDTADVDLDSARLAILGKGRSERESVALTRRCVAAIADWMGHLPPGDGPLFLSSSKARRPKPGARLTGDAARDITVRLGVAGRVQGEGAAPRAQAPGDHRGARPDQRRRPQGDEVQPARETRNLAII